MGKIGLGLLATIAVGAAVFFFYVPARIDGSMNKVAPHEPYLVSDAAKALHARLRVADLHDDMLLWDRDVLKRSTRGHEDLPRLEAGGFRLQVFSAVTKVPKGLNYDENTADSDQITLLAIAQRWPARAWTSLLERAVVQSEKLHHAQEDSGGRLKIVRNQSDLAAALEGDALAAILATEGAHPLEGDLANLDRLYIAGYRMIGLHHFFDNELGGSLHGQSGAGLTEFGRAVVIAAEEKGMIIDVAHSSEAVVRDVLDLARTPLIVSHTGLRGDCDSPRNIQDSLMQEIAARGGVIGVGFWDGAVCETSAQAVVDAIVYAVGLVGADHVALGSDFDGATTTPFDASEMSAITQGLMDAGLDEATIAAVMGENTIGFFQRNLPAN
jgi:microsomal dipeptidase-like Zn-dependent dipeptidase